MQDSELYQGRVLATLRNGFDSGFGDGTFTMFVNFPSQSISGNGIISETDNSEFGFGPIVFDFEGTQISQNGFTGDVSLPGGEIGGTLTDAQYEGRFFGASAESVAGQIFGRIDVDDIDTGTLFEAGFVGNVVDET